MEKKITADMIVNQIINQYPATVGVFKEFGIDSCCGGALPLEEAAKRHGIDLDKILTALLQVKA